MKKILSTLLAALLVNPAYAAEIEERGAVKIPPREVVKSTKRFEEIRDWKTVRAKKGYILSNDLYYQQLCTPTWDKHVKEFKKKNPQIPNPNVIEIGDIIDVQTCRVDIVTTPPVPAPTPAPQKVVKKIAPLDYSTLWPLETVYVDLYGGLISEEKRKDASLVGGIGVHGDLYKYLGYDIRVLGSSIVALTKGEARFKTKPDLQRYVLIYGLGNRIGIGNNDLDRINTGVDSYSYLGVGVEIGKSNKHKVVVDVTRNLTSESNFNVSVSAQKQVFKNQWLGAFIEYHSTKSSVDNRDEDRRYLTGGIKFSF